MQPNPNYCTQNNNPSHSWCTYQATDNITIIVLLAYLGVLVFMAIIIIVQIYRLLRYRRNHELSYEQIFGSRYQGIYGIVCAWLFCGIVKSGINVGVYYGIMIKHQEAGSNNPNPSIDHPIVVMSSIFLVLDFLCAYFVLLLILLIPYQWIYKLLFTLSQRQDNYELKIRKKIDSYFKILKIIKIYTIIQGAIFIAMLIVEPFIFFFVQGTTIACSSQKYNVYAILCHEIVLIGIYVFGYIVSDYLHRNNLIVLTDGDMRRIKFEYFVLMLVLILRVGNFVFKMVSQPNNHSPNQYCADFDDQHDVAATVYLILGNIFMHILPIVVVLLIYRPNLDIATRQERIIWSNHKAGGYSSAYSMMSSSRSQKQNFQ